MIFQVWSAKCKLSSSTYGTAGAENDFSRMVLSHDFKIPERHNVEEKAEKQNASIV